MSKPIQGHCPNCGPRIFADIAGEFNDVWSDDEIGISGNDTHRILQCRGCTRVYFQSSAIFSEDDPSGGPTITHWPSPEKRKKPDWLWKLTGDGNLPSLLEEAYSSFNADANVLAAIGLRTVFDHSSELLGIDPNKTFSQKLDELLHQGKIGAEEREILDVLTNAGSAAAHRGWKPSAIQLSTMFDIVEGFVHRNFFIKHAAKRLRETVPQKSKTRKNSDSMHHRNEAFRPRSIRINSKPQLFHADLTKFIIAAHATLTNTHPERSKRR